MQKMNVNFRTDGNGKPTGVTVSTNSQHKISNKTTVDVGGGITLGSSRNSMFGGARTTYTPSENTSVSLSAGSSSAGQFESNARFDFRF